jgi:hypothetical protein
MVPAGSIKQDQPRPATQAVGGVDSTPSIRAWEHTKRFVSRTSDLRQFVDVPVPSEGLDQQNTRIELAPSDIDVILFVAKSRRLRRHNIKIGIYAPSVPVHKYTEGFFGRCGRTVLLLRLSCENAQNGEIVLDLLESCKGRLAVIRYVPIIGLSGEFIQRQRCFGAILRCVGVNFQYRDKDAQAIHSRQSTANFFNTPGAHEYR